MNSDIDRRLFALILGGQYEQAFREWAAWDSQQTHPRDKWLGIDNTASVNDGTVDLLRRMMAIRSGDEGARLAVDALFGRVGRYDAGRNVWTRARYEQDLADYLRGGFTIGIEISAGVADCAASVSLAGCYRLENAPGFPPAGCSAQCGCTCSWQPIFDDEEPPSPWRKPVT